MAAPSQCANERGSDELTFVAAEDRLQPVSRCWWPSSQQLLLALQLLGAKAHHPQQSPAHHLSIKQLHRLYLACR